MEYEVRYFMEHKALPQALYTNRASLLLNLLRGDKVMSDFYAKAESANPDYNCSYDASQFSVSHREYINEDNAVFIVRIGMPEPESSPLCRAVYICFSGDNYKDMYFTSELAPDGQFFLCGWSANDVHLNFGSTSEDEFARVAELFWEMNRNGGSSEYKSICRGERKLPI